MSSHAKTIQLLLEEAYSEYVFSAYQLFAEHRGVELALHGGITSYWPGGTAVRESTLFDIGSITKAVVTGSVFALAVDRRELSLSDTLGKFIPQFTNTPYESISLLHLLSHSAGIHWWHPLYEDATSKNLVDWLVRHSALVCEAPAGTKTVYSDLGYLLLGLVAEKQWGCLEKVFIDRVATPLGMKSVSYGPLKSGDIAATEFCFNRNRLLQGEIFDENAAYLGGKCAHAGLFSTARGLAPWCREWLKAVAGTSSWLGAESARRAVSAAGVVPGASWGLGWDTKSKIGSSAGDLFSSRSFGHLGFPGCSVWLDPENDGFVILLTNRVHPSRLDERIRRFRPRLHNAVANLWTSP